MARDKLRGPVILIQIQTSSGAEITGSVWFRIEREVRGSRIVDSATLSIVAALCPEPPQGQPPRGLIETFASKTKST